LGEKGKRLFPHFNLCPRTIPLKEKSDPTPEKPSQRFHAGLFVAGMKATMARATLGHEVAAIPLGV
jgi:hypothetical protein